MKVYQNCSPRFGRGIQRVARAIEQHAPGDVSFVEGVPADLIIHHVIGVQNFHPTLQIDHLIAAFPKCRHAVIQYCLRTTENPDLVWWWDAVWSKADVVWSYYDLQRLLEHPEGPQVTAQNCYHAPLGVDPVFHARHPQTAAAPIFLVCTHGHVPETEGVLEALAAARAVGGRVVHLGPPTDSMVAQGDDHVSYVQNVSDAQLAAIYRNCAFVLGLRRVEGFELPAAEGLCSGAVPIYFDQPHYRQWAPPVGAALIAESDPRDVQASVEVVFTARSRYFSARERWEAMTWAQRTFDWRRVVEGFWDRVGDARPQ